MNLLLILYIVYLSIKLKLILNYLFIYSKNYIKKLFNLYKARIFLIFKL